MCTQGAIHTEILTGVAPAGSLPDMSIVMATEDKLSRWITAYTSNALFVELGGCQHFTRLVVYNVHMPLVCVQRHLPGRCSDNSTDHV